MSRQDQIRDRDSIRRDCITAEIEDVEATTTHDSDSIWLSLSEPMKTPTLRNGEWLVNSPKFQFKMSRKAAKKIYIAIKMELMASPDKSRSADEK